MVCLNNMNYDNPAARLLSIIEQGKTIDANFGCRQAWERILNVSNNNPMLMSRLGKAMELTELTISALREFFPQQGNTWGHWESQVNSAFMTQNLNSHWSTFISNIDSHSITYLRMASDLLNAKSNTKILIDADIDSVKIQLNDLCDEIIASTLDDEVRKYLSRYIRKIIVAIDEYRITGALPLLEAVETTIGHAHLHSEYKSFLTDTELGRRLLETLGSMANVVTVAVGIPQITPVIALLAN